MISKNIKKECVAAMFETFIDAVQLRKLLSSLVRTIDCNWDQISTTMSTGEMPNTLFEKNERLELADLIRAAGGVEGLREIISERGLIN